MIIRTFDASDREAVIALWRDVFPEYADASRPQRDPALSIANKMSTQPELFFVGTVEDRVVGTVMSGYDGHRGWVYSLAVAPALRRRGYGATLMRHAEEALAARGCPKVNLQILAVKTELRGFYEKLGYRMDEVVSLGKRL
ncbi:GNAT family acetyltransferase [Caballeronia sp. LP006]|uniref:GNAT family acetyltransferase n=1 Tax=unclassified Caballeronia TaxID=2646786 RepID=UPI001FD46564|nr:MULTISPECIES: GNAT family acetyltransferase [unclassified Caballeronia]MDR5770740.1 GNAT family acetyltransferase [Caballeronia sp. LZ002]MDR5802867.1 GNAT family acetyltransferase [Caballeronia sp. LZ001]MDR5830482.1 GNAT family acetyltransferase [Caballeronia sp. LP006]MDR5846177.1 GNAT family acetyltransferase [Caballeronia sp. LZ003]